VESAAKVPSPPEAPAPEAPRPRSPWRRRAAIAGVLATAARLARFTLLAPKAVPVKVVAAAKGRVEETAANSKAGTVKTRRRALLSPEVGGRVAVLPVAMGSTVTMGALLLKIADGDLGAQVAVAGRAADSARASVAEAAHAEAQAARDLSRWEKLEAERIASHEIVDQLRTKKETAAAAKDGARARLRQALASLDALARVLVRGEDLVEIGHGSSLST
jgi:HlyD family secretion protein